MKHSKKYKAMKKKLGVRGETKPGDLMTEHQRLAQGMPLDLKHMKHRKHEKHMKEADQVDPANDVEHLKAAHGHLSAVLKSHEFKKGHSKHEKTMCKHCKGHHATSEHAKHMKHMKHKKNWIAGAIKKPGSLKKSLGVKAGSKIPKSRLSAAAKKGGVLGKRANLAKTLEGFNK